MTTKSQWWIQQGDQGGPRNALTLAPNSPLILNRIIVLRLGLFLNEIAGGQPNSHLTPPPPSWIRPEPCFTNLIEYHDDHQIDTGCCDGCQQLSVGRYCGVINGSKQHHHNHTVDDHTEYSPQNQEYLKHRTGCNIINRRKQHHNHALILRGSCREISLFLSYDNGLTLWRSRRIKIETSVSTLISHRALLREKPSDTST